MKRKKISELAKQIRGVSYKTEDLHENLDENSVTLLRANNIFEGRINFDDVVYVDKSRVAREQYLCKGDILVCASSGSKQLVGKAASFNFDTECTFGAFCKVVRPNQDVANYLSMYFQSNAYRRKISEVAIGANINNIRNEHIDALELPIGSNAENEKVVASFSLLQQIIDGRKQQLHKLDELIKSRFIELFGDPETNPKEWTRQRLDQICENLDSRRVPITSTDRKTGNYPYYGASGIVDYVEDYIFDEDILLISEDGANLVMRSTPIAFSVSGKVWVNNHAHVVRFESKATQKYIEICFALTDISGSITGTAQPKLNQAKLNAMMFCVPPIELQKQFAAFVEQADKSKLAVQKGLQELEILKKSLMQQYFG